MTSKTLIVFHRSRGKSLSIPPNSIIGVKWAIEYGAKAIEYDVVVVRDREKWKMVVIEPVLLRDNVFDIDNLDWNDVSKIDVGNNKHGIKHPSTLQDVLKLINQDKIKQQIHIKGNNKNTVSTLVSEIDNPKNITITSFDLNILDEVKKKYANLQVGWIVKPDNKSGNEQGKDLTKIISDNPNKVEPYSEEEIDSIINLAKIHLIDTVILCGPKINKKNLVDRVRNEGFEVGSWGVGDNLGVAKRLMNFNIDRFTIDNPEELLV